MILAEFKRSSLRYHECEALMREIFGRKYDEIWLVLFLILISTLIHNFANMIINIQLCKQHNHAVHYSMSFSKTC